MEDISLPRNKSFNIKEKRTVDEKTESLIRDKVDANVILWPMLGIFKLTGIFPVKIRWIRRQNGESRMKVNPSARWIIIAGILLAVTVVHTLWAPTMLIRLERSIMTATATANRTSHNQTGETNVKTFTSKQRLVIKVLHPLLICITSLTARSLSVSILPRRIPNLMKKLNKVDEVLALPKEMRCKNGAALLSFVAVSFILNIPLMAYHLRQLSFFHSGWGNAWEAFSIFNIFTTFSMELQFMTFCYIVRSRLVYVNKRLGEFVADEFTCDESDNIENIFSSRNKINSEILRSVIRLNVEGAINNIRNVHGSELVRSLRSANILLYDIMDDINGIYQFHLLISISTSVSKILFNLYFSIFGFMASPKIPSKVHRAQMYIMISWTIYYCLRFLLIVSFAHTTAKESQKTKSILIKMDMRGIEEVHAEEMKMFFEYLSRRDFEFSACGLFNLNMALITSSFSSGITYLVMMAQFH